LPGLWKGLQAVLASPPNVRDRSLVMQATALVAPEPPLASARVLLAA